MSQGQGGGQPTKFSPQLTADIISGIEQVTVLRQACGFARITYQSLWNYLNIGKQDIIDGNYTDYAKFFYDVKTAQFKKVKYLMKCIEDRVTNWQASAWILERCFREDFGNDGGVIHDLLEKCDKLAQAFQKMNNSAPEGLK